VAEIANPSPQWVNIRRIALTFFPGVSMTSSKLNIYLTIASLAFLASCGIGEDEDFTGPFIDEFPPYILSITPQRDGVGPSEDIRITFTENMDPDSAFGNVAFEPAIAFNLVWPDAHTLNIEHDDFTAGTEYNLLLRGLSDLAGNPLGSSEDILFRSAFPPRLQDRSPINSQTNVNRAVQIVLGFTEEMDLTSLKNAITIDDGTGTLMASSPVTAFDLTLGLYYQVILVFDAALPANSLIRVEIAASALSAAGLALESDEIFSFTTGTEIIMPPHLISVVPENLSEIPPSQQEIVFTFSAAINSSSLQTSLISAQLLLVLQNAGLEPIWSPDATTLTIPLPNPLPAGLPIAITIATYADWYGNIQTDNIEYRVAVSGAGDPWPLIDGSKYSYYKIWGEIDPEEGNFYASNDNYYRVEGQPNGTMHWAAYYDFTYGFNYEYVIFNKTESMLEEVGDYYRAWIDVDPERSTSTPGIQLAHFPFVTGDSWTGSSAIVEDGENFNINYSVNVATREDVISTTLEYFGADVIWLDCWKVVATWTGNQGGPVLGSGDVTRWIAPSIGIVKATETNSDVFGFSDESTEELRSWVPGD
jgi:hypothetical protein